MLVTGWVLPVAECHAELVCRMLIRECPSVRPLERTETGQVVSAGSRLKWPCLHIPTWIGRWIWGCTTVDEGFPAPEKVPAHSLPAAAVS